jgi:hypothetical protein
VIETGPQCVYPYTCSFCEYCNRDKVAEPAPDYPLSSLPRFHWRKHELMEELGIDDLRNVPDEYLSDTQAHIKQHTVAGTVFFDTEGAAADLAPYGFPAYFLDFETVMLTVPIWKGTRPFRQIPFQFSLHILEESGSIQHHGFLDLSGDDPSLACAESLVNLCAENGPIFAYNAGFEKMVIRELADRFPTYAAALETIIERVVDLHPIAKNRYYHPSQHGSWSLKAVLPALCPELSYGSLDGVQDGSMAVSAYQEAIAPETTNERKAQIQSQLREYCKLDTFAMVRIWEMFRGV